MSPSTSIAGLASRTPSIDLEDGQAGAPRFRPPRRPRPRRSPELPLDKLRQYLPLFAYVLVDASAREPALRKLLVMALASPELEGAVRRLVLLVRGESAPPPVPRAWSVLVTHLLDPIHAEASPLSLRPDRGPVLGRLDAARRLARRLKDRLGGDAIEPKGEPYPESRVVPERCRAPRSRVPRRRGRRRDPPWCACRSRRGDRSRGGPASRGGASAWRSAAAAPGVTPTSRWRQLEARGIPIDIIGGSSPAR